MSNLPSSWTGRLASTWSFVPLGLVATGLLSALLCLTANPSDTSGFWFGRRGSYVLWALACLWAWSGLALVVGLVLLAFKVRPAWRVWLGLALAVACVVGSIYLLDPLNDLLFPPPARATHSEHDPGSERAAQTSPPTNANLLYQGPTTIKRERIGG